jgi:hypothetical protein
MFWIAFHNRKYSDSRNDSGFYVSLMFHENEMYQMRIELAEHAKEGEWVKVDYSSRYYSAVIYDGNLETAEDIQTVTKLIANFTESL